MTIYSFWIFDRHCNCIFNREYTQVSNPSIGSNPTGVTNSKDLEDTSKLLFGALFSMKNIAHKLNISSNDQSNDSIDENSLISFSTSNYRANFYETASGLKFCILTDLKTKNLKDELKYIHSEIYGKYVVRNPLSPVDFKPGDMINNEKFRLNIENYLQNL